MHTDHTPPVSLPTAQETDEELCSKLLSILKQRTTAAREWERQLHDERAAHERTKKQYATAIQSRLMLRDAFRKWRERAMTLEAWVQEYGWPIMDELEQWQNGHPPLAALREKLEAAERQLGETQAALTEAEQRGGAAREPLAAYAHEAWSGWMRYLWGKGTVNPDGTLTLPEWAVIRWGRQMSTTYADLPENEKESDRKEADAILQVIAESGGRDE